MDNVQPELKFDKEVLNAGKQALRAINHKLRQQMIQLIHSNQLMTVTEIYIKLRLEQSVASQHLAILRREKFLNTKRDRRFIYYSVNYERIKEVHEISKRLGEQEK
jgi:DNA-binding transcriptional ArsR family regulator